MNPQRRLRAVRRTVLAAVVVSAVLAFVAAFVGMGIPGVVIVPAAVVAVIAAIAWLVLASVERRAADRHAAQGRSWRPSGSTAR